MKQNNKKIIRAVTVSQSTDFFREVSLKMREQGYEIVALSSPGKELEALKVENGLHVIEVPMERHISLTKDIVSLWKVIKALRRERPQVVHSMTPKAGLLCMMAAWLTRVPVRIHTFTGLVWPTATGLKRKLLMATDWLTCACATRVIPEGQGVKSDLQQITKKPMKVLGYGNVMGVDMKRFDPSRIEHHKADRFRFLFVGRLVGDKGVNELVEAFARLHEKYGNTELSLVGSLESELDPLGQITMNRIASEITIITPGPKREDDLVVEYANADCFVMPSYREGFPNTVLEAGAMELPCIVTDINGSREIIDNGVNGLIVPSKNVDALYAAMEQMLTDDKMRQQMALKAREMIASRFDKDYVQKCLIDFYESIFE